MLGFLLEEETEVIAVIEYRTNKDDFYVAVRKAIAEHFISEEIDTSLLLSDEEYKLDVRSITFEAETIENEESCIRVFTLTETCIY